MLTPVHQTTNRLQKTGSVTCINDAKNSAAFKHNSPAYLKTVTSVYVTSEFYRTNTDIFYNKFLRFKTILHRTNPMRLMVYKAVYKVSFYSDRASHV